jgi:hypothetical protein
MSQTAGSAWRKQKIFGLPAAGQDPKAPHLKIRPTFAARKTPPAALTRVSHHR